MSSAIDNNTEISNVNDTRLLISIKQREILERPEVRRYYLHYRVRGAALILPDLACFIADVKCSIIQPKRFNLSYGDVISLKCLLRKLLIIQEACND